MSLQIRLGSYAFETGWYAEPDVGEAEGTNWTSTGQRRICVTTTTTTPSSNAQGTIPDLAQRVVMAVYMIKAAACRYVEQ